MVNSKSMIPTESGYTYIIHRSPLTIYHSPFTIYDSPENEVR